MPNSYANTGSSCTLPRHPTHPNHHWPSYGGTIAGVRHIPQMTIGGSQQQQHQHQQHQQQIIPPPPSSIAMQHLGPTARPRVCIGVPEDDVSAETPLMVKRESTV